MTTANDTTKPLDGLSLLIIEDEVIIGMMLLNEMERVGATSVGPVTSVAAALKEIEAGIADVAIVDSKLADGSAADLADALEHRGMRYVVVSGYESGNLPERLKGAPFVPKPISVPLLIETIERVARCAAVPLSTGPAPPVASRHFEVNGAERGVGSSAACEPTTRD
jgi:DNA-binding NtrC family response regulator